MVYNLDIRWALFWFKVMGKNIQLFFFFLRELQQLLMVRFFELDFYLVVFSIEYVLLRKANIA